MKTWIKINSCPYPVS